MAKKPQAHADRDHATLSPSGASRWFECPGSPAAEAPFPRTSNVHADEGTAAHELGEICLRNDFDPVEFLGGYVDIKKGKVYREEAAGDVEHDKDKGLFTVDEEMVDGAWLYVETVRSHIAEGDEYEFEAKLDLTHIPGMEFGTGDFIRYRPSTKELVVIDFKYGRGVRVDVKENEQLLCYAEGTAKRFHNRGLDKVKLVVVQPRYPDKERVREWTIDALELVEFRYTLIDKANATMVENPPRIPGDHCRWCKAAASCEALRSHSLKVAEMEFSDEPPKVADMDAEKIADLMTKADVVENWIKAIKNRAHEIASNDGLPGWKLVHSTSHRKWKDDDEALKYLGAVVELTDEQIYAEPKMKSPAAVEKILGSKRKKEIEGLIYKPPGKIILVPESDPRAPAKVDAEEEFA